VQGCQVGPTEQTQDDKTLVVKTLSEKNMA
jgi:hypothetical protein